MGKLDRVIFGRFLIFLLKILANILKFLKLIWADGAYAHSVEEIRKHFGWKLDIVRKSDKAKGFEILPHRWIVERTFGWLGRYRRLSRDFEHTVSSSESVVY